MKIILASLSPRRFDLLSTLGQQVKVVAPDIVELDDSHGLKPEVLALTNAQLKARVVFQRHGIADYDVVLAADTIVVQGERVFGKPKDEAEALSMLSVLAGKTHNVLTGFWLMGKGGREFGRCVSSTVEFRALAKHEIRAYLLCEEWRDKAGAYAVQGLGAALIRQVMGSITNVIGLPLDEVMDDAQLLL